MISDSTRNTGHVCSTQPKTRPEQDIATRSIGFRVSNNEF